MLIETRKEKNAQAKVPFVTSRRDVFRNIRYLSHESLELGHAIHSLFCGLGIHTVCSDRPFIWVAECYE